MLGMDWLIDALHHFGVFKTICANATLAANVLSQKAKELFNIDILHCIRLLSNFMVWSRSDSLFKGICNMDTHLIGSVWYGIVMFSHPQLYWCESEWGRHFWQFRTIGRNRRSSTLCRHRRTRGRWPEEYRIKSMETGYCRWHVARLACSTSSLTVDCQLWFILYAFTLSVCRHRRTRGRWSEEYRIKSMETGYCRWHVARLACSTSSLTVDCQLWFILYAFTLSVTHYRSFTCNLRCLLGWLHAPQI